MLTWLLTEVIPHPWQVRIGERLFGPEGFHGWICPACNNDWDDDDE